jgi:hypothetical protein
MSAYYVKDRSYLRNSMRLYNKRKGDIYGYRESEKVQGQVKPDI